MGKSSRWLLSLLGIKKSSKASAKGSSSPSESSKHETRKASKEKRRRSFGRPPQHHSSEEVGTSYNANEGVEQEQAKHAVVVAAAISAAAEAAGAAAHAAAAIAHLNESYLETAEREEWAAMKIQTAFRGYLARRALRALKGLVRLQALFRGHRVRKQAALTLRCMQALVRVQARVRARRVRMSEEGQAVQQQLMTRHTQHSGCPRKSTEGWNAAAGTVEDLQAKAEQRHLGAIKRERALAYAFSQQVRKSSPKEGPFIEYEPEAPHWGWSWLERWMAARPWESPAMEKAGYEDSPVEQSSAGSTRIVEVDSVKSRQHRNKSTPNELISSDPDAAVRQQMASWPSPSAFASQLTAPYPRADSPRRVQNATPNHVFQPSPVSFRRSNAKQKQMKQDIRLNGLGIEAIQDDDQYGDTTVNSSSGYSATAPKSGVKCQSSGSAQGEQSGEMLQHDQTYPSYMTATQSAKAKFRSRSTPKQRPDLSENSMQDSINRLSLPGSDRTTISATSRSEKSIFQLRNSAKGFVGSTPSDRSLTSLINGQSTQFL